MHRFPIMLSTGLLYLLLPTFTVPEQIKFHAEETTAIVKAESSLSPVEENSDRLYGVTIDSVADISEILGSLAEVQRARRPIVRIVFDADQKAKDYATEVEAISHGGNDVMGLVSDSSSMYHYKKDDGSDYKKRFEKYINGLGENGRIWEIGNEVNGEWVGYPRKKNETDDKFEKRLQEELPSKSPQELDKIRRRTAAQVTAAFSAVTDKTRTALTLFYNDDQKPHDPACENEEGHCWPNLCKNNIRSGQDYEMFSWVNKYLTDPAVRNDLGYVFISFYQDDCHLLSGNVEQDIDNFARIFTKLSVIFPKAKLGFGEFAPQCSYDKTRKGEQCIAEQREFIQRYYKTYDEKLKTKVPNYVGGYFYWYFKEDMVPKDKPALKKLIETLQP
jgi:hypothetical protein